MPSIGLNVINTAVPAQNLLLFLALPLAVAATVAVVAAWITAIDGALRALRWLRYRRVVLAWRLVWLVALPVLEPLALVWATLAPLATRPLPRPSVLIPRMSRRRDAFRPVAGQVARWV